MAISGPALCLTVRAHLIDRAGPFWGRLTGLVRRRSLRLPFSRNDGATDRNAELRHHRIVSGQQDLPFEFARFQLCRIQPHLQSYNVV